MKIISISGPKGSGKDASAKILQDLGVSKGKISFAGPLKEICSKVFRIPVEKFEDAVFKETPFETPLILGAGHVLKILDEMSTYLPSTEEFTYLKPGTRFDIDVPILTPRHLLQYVGTEMIRDKVHPDWHVMAAFRESVVSKIAPSDIYCVTDARFVNEYEWLRANFDGSFLGLYVERPEAEAILAQATHKSELEILNVKKLIPEGQTLSNNSTLSNLVMQLRQQLIRSKFI